jgi:hypothetical protein
MIDVCAAWNLVECLIRKVIYGRWTKIYGTIDLLNGSDVVVTIVFFSIEIFDFSCQLKCLIVTMFFFRLLCDSSFLRGKIYVIKWLEKNCWDTISGYTKGWKVGFYIYFVEVMMGRTIVENKVVANFRSVVVYIEWKFEKIEWIED